VSAIPVVSRYSSARFASRRGSLAYGSRVIGSAISQISESVDASVKGSRIADEASGISSMSDSEMPCQRGSTSRQAEAVVERGLVERADRQRHVLPRPEEVAELQVDHLRRRLTGPLQCLACVGRARLSIREVVLRLFDRHAAPSDRDHKKRAQDSH